ncbi:MAG: SPFH domain-containing protein, partial [Terriglobales bacterium]
MNYDLIWISLYLLALVALRVAVKSAGPNEWIVVYRNGNLNRICGPGTVLIWPLLETIKKIYIGVQTASLPQIAFGAGAKAFVSGSFSYRVLDPRKAGRHVINYKLVASAAIEAALRTVLG